MKRQLSNPYPIRIFQRSLASAIGAAVATLTKLAISGTSFAIVLTEQPPGSDWTFKSIAFNSCYFTSISPSNVTLDDSPTATFSGVCLDVEPTS